MSADNGVYVLRTLKYPTKSSSGVYTRQDGYEYRVKRTSGSMIDETEHSDLAVAAIFGNCKVFENSEEAFNEAQNQHDSAGWTEHGIVSVYKDYYFPAITQRAAALALTVYQGCEKIDIDRRLR